MTDPRRIAAVILAAGRSSRMKAFKPMLPLGQERVIERTINNFRAAGITELIVVVGHRAEELTAFLDHLRVPWVLNENFDEGMYASLLTGLGSIDSKCEWFFMMPGDIALVQASTLEGLLDASRENHERIFHPTCDNRRGHPPLLSAEFIPGLLAFDGPGGLRAFLADSNLQACDVPCGDEGILMDMDTLEQYALACELAEREARPSREACLHLLEEMHQPQALIRHSEKVAWIAWDLARQLEEAGLDLDPELAWLGGMLHDLAKGRKAHANEGARLLRKRGWFQLAAIVASHIDLWFDECDPLNESALVYLADKLLRGEDRVGIDERYGPKLLKYAAHPEALKAVRRRLEIAGKIMAAIEQKLGHIPTHFQ